MKMTVGLSILLVGVPVFLFSVSRADAQARRATPRGSSVQPTAKAEGEEGAVIRKMEATGPNTRVKTPKFNNNANEPQAKAENWARISVQYETDVEWTDALEFRYMVVVKHPKTSAFSMFPVAVTYIDIPKGKRHTSTVFLRPNTLKRYGNVEWAGVKIYLKGKDTPVAVAQMPNDPRPWTAKLPKLTTKNGVLLNRDQTPFAQVAIDNYETIKPK